jgi:hypothetical protein
MGFVDALLIPARGCCHRAMPLPAPVVTITRSAKGSGQKGVKKPPSGEDAALRKG